MINGKFLAVHGGISPEAKLLSDLNKVQRVQEPPRKGVLCDLLWADPVDNEQGLVDSQETQHFQHNTVRGCSYYFGQEAVNAFLSQNGLLSIIRGHEP